MNIGLFTSVFFNNIGNGFLDLGLEYELSHAKSSDDVIVKVSQCANFAASLGRLFTIKEIPIVKWMWEHLMQGKFAKKMHNKTYDIVEMNDVLSPASMFKLDYLVIPGCVLTIHFFKIYYNLLKKKTEQGCKIIFIGASGNYYTDDEIKYVTKCLKCLKPYAIMTRDHDAFELYKNYSTNVYDGIDNAFFVNCLNIPELESDASPYVVLNLENAEHKKLKKELVEKAKREGKNVIFTDHQPYPYLKVSKMVKQDNTVISDYPMDYLMLYRNAEAVITDRVHATITALAFGNSVTLYSESPRKALLENVGINYTPGEVLKVDNLKQRQNAQIEFLSGILR